MHYHYQDILEMADRDPDWWDENAVPRFCKFGPQAIADIYADECCLLLIQCQCCHRPFRVAMSTSLVDRIISASRFAASETNEELRQRWERHALRHRIKEGSIHYGDPPNFGCCPAGPTMNCDDIRVLEYWHKPREGEQRFEWVRDQSLEIELEGEL